MPHSDPSNTGGWVLNDSVSDEFDGEELDTNKWFVQGRDDGYHKWKGRAPSQFAPHNVTVADGHLVLTSRWEPDYAFSKEEFGGRNYENITTAGIISEASFLYGYMETRSKAGDAAMTSSFWALGYQSELDMFEQMGRPRKADPNTSGGNKFEKAYMFSIHDWRPEIIKGENKIFTHTHQLPYRVADDFHVYGCEWDPEFLKFYVDGKLVYTRTRKELDDAWVITNPLEIWFDSETFPWFGLPTEEDLPAEFKIDYVRVWQKPDSNLLDRAFHGFEGPILLRDVPLPEDKNQHHKFWYMPDHSKPHFSISTEKYFSGRKSLKFTHDGKTSVPEVSAMAPNGTSKLGAGPHVISLKLWLDRNCTLKQLHPILDEPWLQIKPINLTSLPRMQWITVEVPFSRDGPSGKKDRLRFTAKAADMPEGKSTIYIDDVAIRSSSAD
ncbi:family 16 glycosylhydrolase [Haloferula sp.]